MLGAAAAIAERILNEKSADAARAVVSRVAGSGVLFAREEANTAIAMSRNATPT